MRGPITRGSRGETRTADAAVVVTGKPVTAQTGFRQDIEGLRVSPRTASRAPQR